MLLARIIRVIREGYLSRKRKRKNKKYNKIYAPANGMVVRTINTIYKTLVDFLDNIPWMHLELHEILSTFHDDKAYSIFLDATEALEAHPELVFRNYINGVHCRALVKPLSMAIYVCKGIGKEVPRGAEKWALNMESFRYRKYLPMLNQWVEAIKHENAMLGFEMTHNMW